MMQVGICWLSVNNFECLTPRFKQSVKFIKNSHGRDCPAGLSRWTVAGSSIVCPSRRWRVPLLWNTVPCDSQPLGGATVTAHGTQCYALFLNDGNSAVAAYREVFLFCQPPAGAVVAAHTVMLSRQAAEVAAVDVVNFFVI